MSEHPDLPTFERPPLVEVVLACYFEPLVQLRQTHLGSFWERVRERFPQVDDREPLPEQVETLDDQPRLSAVHFELLSQPILNRSIVTNGDQTELIQIQRDRFVHNWRRQVAAYPRFRKVHQSFSDEFADFQASLNGLGFPPLALTQEEVTYVNWVTTQSLSDMLTVLVPSHLTGAGTGPG